MNASFETSRLSIDPILDLNAVSAEDISKILSKSVTKYLPSNWQELSQPNEAIKWLGDRMMDGGFHSIKNCSDHTLVGFLFLNGEPELQTDPIHIGYLLAEESWGQGLASEIIEGLIAHCRLKAGISTLTGGVAPQNKGSIKVLEKNGFALSGIENETAFYSYTFDN